MRVKNSFFGIALVSSLLILGIACGGNEEPSSEPAQETVQEESEMYEASELAELMRKMYEDNEEIRAGIMNGELPSSFPEDFYTIHTAEATNPDEINDTYHALAEEYTKNMEAIVEADETQVIDAFNNMVNTCVTCHQIYCQGPIPKIKKLRIPSLDEA